MLSSEVFTIAKKKISTREFHARMNSSAKAQIQYQSGQLKRREQQVSVII